MTGAEATACKGCVEIPWALAATDVAYNVKGVPNKLKLTGPVLADIFTGQITTWNAPQIAKLNPGVNLPSTKITPIHRTDGSGDTYAFTNYLSHVDPAFKSKIGASTTVNWPGGLGAKGNSGVGGALQATNGGIAYIAIAYVLQNSFDNALVQNAAGQYPDPEPGVDRRGGTRRHDDPVRRHRWDLAGRPAGLGQDGLPDLDVHLRDRPEDGLERGRSVRAAEVHQLGDHDRAGGRPEARLRAVAGPGGGRPTSRRSS